MGEGWTPYCASTRAPLASLQSLMTAILRDGMSGLKYQVTTFGTGFRGRGRGQPDEAVEIAREKLLKVDPPYHFHEDPREEHPRPEILRMLEERLLEGGFGDKFVIMGSNYDEPGVAVRIIRDDREVSPLVSVAKKHLGERYVFGHIFPPDGDCSGLVVLAVQEVHGITLTHLSEAIRVDSRVRTFHDHDDTRSGDFIFYHFSDRNGVWPRADDITMVVDDDLQIGARPSRGGVAIFEREPELRWLVEYGRLQV
jgi:NlpC/P60 family